MRHYEILKLNIAKIKLMYSLLEDHYLHYNLINFILTIIMAVNIQSVICFLYKYYFTHLRREL